MRCLQVSLPNGEVLKLSNPDNREILERGPLSVGSLSLLRESSVYGCCKLLSVFPSQLLPMLRDLEKLFVKSCNLLEVVFESGVVDSSGPNPDILSSLKRVELHMLPKLNYISKRDPIGFNYIKTLDIDHCDMLRYVFSPTMMKSFQKLRRLKISKCEMLSRIVAEENGLGERSVEEVEFPELKELELHDRRNLVSFFPDANNPLQPQALFNAKVNRRSNFLLKF
ncbi:hypothetical protein Vadar_024148 [Vaccinium darrowii]|uniref:Uncharacterized protein n=1 Tax=Vaccinium darrowii TaxID=229202 RepID=A0ACB7YRB5_9ERIC|nr:hypothetical protein Vadar_024148 [Vaccinium darrowii]